MHRDAHGPRALLVGSPEGVTDYIDADLRDPDTILDAAAQKLDLTQPVALIMMNILGHITDDAQAYAVVSRLLDALPSGSYLAVNDGTSTNTASQEAQQRYNADAPVPYHLRSPEQVDRFFDGLELVEPGVVPSSRWRPEPNQFGPPAFRRGCVGDVGSHGFVSPLAGRPPSPRRLMPWRSLPARRPGAGSVTPRRAVASFDSATGMLRALSRFLHGRDVPLIGQAPGALEPLATAVLTAMNRLPRGARQRLYAAGGWTEAIPPGAAGAVASADLAAWVAGHYPGRQYPAVFIGSSNGAAIHLAAALGVPWLPQTLLVPVRHRGIHPDDSVADRRFGERPGQRLLRANPDIALHHMRDPNQDRLMIAGMSYFRVKWRRLPGPYREFLRTHLPRGATVVVLDCTLRWPTTLVGERHVFQHGALGGATAEEFHHGGPRVSEFLAAQGATRRRWEHPPADETSPEAEWGFDRALLPDLAELAAEQGWDLRVLRFPDPDALSPAVADLYRSWYADRGVAGGRLLVECFLLLEPWQILRTGSVPYWMSFNTELSHRALRAYLDDVDPYDEIRLLLFSHGVDSIGLVPAATWEREVTAQAREHAGLLGVDRRAFPRDFASLARAHRELTRLRPRYPMAGPLELEHVDTFLRTRSDVEWTSPD